jgi:hypothetical protein
MCVDVCHPNESITCGVYGRSVSMYFVIGPMLQMNLSDVDDLQIQGVNFDSFYVLFGFPVSSYQFDNFELIHPERTCGIIVNSATVNKSGQYMCTIEHFAARNNWRVMLKQTLQLCGR